MRVGVRKVSMVEGIGVEEVRVWGGDKDSS